MRILHNSRDLTYRTPFGAAPLGGTVRLSVDVFDAPYAQATLRLWVEGQGETLVPMARQELYDRLRFSVEIVPSVLELYWYFFIVDDGAGNVRFLGAPEGRVGGVGTTYWSEPPSFQITVYKKRAVYPEWWERAIVYQIFPDRFFRGSNWEGTVKADLEKERNGTRRRLVEDWNTPPSYERDKNGDVIAWDFYGGTIDGIIEKLDYLYELGVSAIYLNPIFEALSDHRYDTGDYLKVDPILGDQDSFRRLALKAAEHGISLVLDGVFNHTGIDSIYFNAYGNYDSIGAAQSPDSPYRDWYQFRPDGTYESWWGVKNMPAMNKSSKGWREFVFGKDGVIDTWLRSGARGWRLDVADELSDEFIARIKECESAEKPDALLLGEVWEDASHKVAYSQMRHYFMGEELDGVMNYPFRTGLLSFLRGEMDAPAFAEEMESLHENYPPHAFRSCLTLLGSHDRARVFTMLSGAPDPESLTDEEKRTWKIPEKDMGLAKARLWLALLVQMCWPGPPSIYYGDEAGLQGMTDPYNRAPYPWGAEDPDTMAMYKNAIDLRRSLPLLTDGDFKAMSVGKDVFGFWRGDAGECACVLVNRSTTDTAMVELPMRGESATELVSGLRLAVSSDGERVTLPIWPLSGAVVYFHKAQGLAKSLDWGSGVFCSLTSVPNEKGPGTLGEPARRFVDWLEAAGQRYWQILPVNPPDAFGSPYGGPSAFAGNPALIETGDQTLEDYVNDFCPGPDYAKFRENESEWLEPYILFMAIREHLAATGEASVSDPWWCWPERYRSFDDALLDDPELAPRIRYHAKLQYLFYSQMRELKEYAHTRGVQIIGDMPIYVAADSVDTWAHTELFHMGKDGTMTQVSGYPPDGETPEGQLWGSPIYHWSALRKDDYHWWLERFRRSFDLYDTVRMDHFLGFARYWSIPAGASAAEGRWLRGPGAELFQRAYRRFGALPIVAEDLGDITCAVRSLIATTGIPGMDIAIFTDTDVREEYVPRAGKIAYTTTHDTQTLLGWVEERFFSDLHETPTEHAHRLRARVLESPNATSDAQEARLDLAEAKSDLAREALEAKALTVEIARRVMASDAPVVIQPLQDVLVLGNKARMNVPGTTSGNWRWQAKASDLENALDYLRKLTEDTARLPTDPAREQSPRRRP